MTFLGIKLIPVISMLVTLFDLRAVFNCHELFMKYEIFEKSDCLGILTIFSACLWYGI